MNSSPLRIPVCFALASAGLGAQSWHQQAPLTSPPPRLAHAMATDATSGRIVMFGGAIGSVYLGDTWRYDGANWLLNAGPGPAARMRHAMACDDVRGAIVMFGGINGTGFNNWFGDTWEYSAGSWHARTSSNHPAVRFGHAMAYDRTRGRVVMFGGRTRSGVIFLGDTWEWDGNDWLSFVPPHAPTPRMGHAMAFDPQRGQVLLFGGIQVFGPVQSDTWVWSGLDWTQLAPAHAPTARWNAAMATDSLRGRIVLHGGADVSYSTDTAEWNGSDWSLLPAGNSPIAVLPAMATGVSGRHVVLFGGEDLAGTAHAETWVYGQIASVRAFGTGCGAIPLALEAVPGSAPILGQTFANSMRPVPPGGVPFQSLGFSTTSSGGVPLPIDLGPVGMPGCTQYHDAAELFLPCTLLGDTATHTALVPDVPALAGVEVYLQGFALAPGSNPFGAITSNALAVVLGYR